MRKGNHGGDWAAYQAKHDALPRLDFSANVSPLGPPEGVKRAMREAIEHVAQYPDPRCCALRKALGEHHGADPAHILCGNGAADLIDRLALALRPKRALVTAPTFSEYAEALERVGGQVISFPLREEHSFAVTPEILDAITPDLDVLFLCEPNNPTGRTTEPGLLQAILEKGRACGVLVVLDEENNPVACEKQAAQVLRDGVVVDYTGALRIVRSLKEKLEARLGTELVNCAIAMPAGTESSVKTHQYVAEGAGLEVTNILDEPSAANAIYQIEDGVVVDIGGGTTGLAILKEGKVVQIEDEPTGGTHLTLVLSGNYHVSFEEAEAIKQDYKRHREILPVVRPVVEKMATIVSRYVDKAHTDTIYLCGGTCCLTGIEDIFQKVTGIRTIKPANPFLVTPTGIAMNCTLE